MRLRRELVVLLLVAFSVVWLLPRDRSPLGAVLHAAAYDPYQTEILAPYAELRDAIQNEDADTLRAIAAGDDYRAYRAALAVAQDFTLPAALRLEAFDRVLALRVEDPLASDETRALHLEIGRIAEAAGQRERALEAYRTALPDPTAEAGLERIEPDPYRRANAFLQARMYRDALDALGGRTAPSIEAPAQRALGNYAEGMDAYRRWLSEQPWNADAQLGVAWSHYYLGEWQRAADAFAAIPGPDARYGEALSARRLDELDRALALLRQTGSASRMWLGTEWLEARERWGDALDLYLEIARTQAGTSQADDAAYRAYVLAGRLGLPEQLETARSLIPPGSFYDLLLGGSVRVPTESDLPPVEPDVVPLAHALIGVHDVDAAVGELRLALRDAPTVAEGVVIAEMLQTMGDWRQSQRWAAGLADDIADRRVWRLAWPEAYPEAVRAEATAHDVDPELIWAVMRQESAFYPRARSRSDARGLMQVIPSTWDWLAELQDELPGNPFDPSDNIRYGAFYLRYLLDYFQDDMQLAVASYNRGQGYIRRLFESPEVAADKDELFRKIDALETREYLQRVVVNYEVYRALD